MNIFKEFITYYESAMDITQGLMGSSCERDCLKKDKSSTANVSPWTDKKPLVKGRSPYIS
jgi:hypothetical protein